MSFSNTKKYRDEVENELKNNILPFWMKNAIDDTYGGFYGFISNDLNINKEAPKGSVLASRILWTFSHAYSIYSDNSYLQIAERAYNYLTKYFFDKKYGGVYWKLDFKGNPVETKKQVYAQAFAIYGLTEYYSITKNKNILKEAQDIFYCIQRYAYDTKYKGYYDACKEDWSLESDMSLSDKDLNSRKSMNTNLHILEAYTNLLKYWQDELLKTKLSELILVTVDKIIDTENYHFKLYFDDNWESLNDHVSYGHDIEGSWLLLEAAEELKNDEIIKSIKKISIEMAKSVYFTGVDKDGAVVNEGNKDGITNHDRDWWPQAEALVGFLNAYRITKDKIYLEASVKNWDFIKNFFVDKKNGEWFWSVDNTGSVNNSLEKVGFWKCPYHNSRACFEIMKRLDELDLK